MKKTPQISVQEAALKISSGDVLVVGGFGMTGTPVHLLDAIAETSVKDLTMISNNVGEPGLGGGRMLRNGQISKAIGSFFTTNPEVVLAYQSGEIEVELLPLIIKLFIGNSSLYWDRRIIFLPRKSIFSL